MSDITDPIDGLIRYVNEIKPFHSKIIEVLTEYVYEEDLNITLSERTLLDEGIYIGGVPVEDNESDKFGGTYGNGPYDNAAYFPVISYNSTIPGGAFTTVPSLQDKRGYNFDTKEVIIPDDQTATYRPGRIVVLELFRHNDGSVDPLLAGETSIDDIDLEILTSEYVTVGQTNGIFDTPHTTVTFDVTNADMFNPDNYSLGADETFSANIRLKPTAVVAVVTSDYAQTTTNTAKIRYSTVAEYGPGTLINNLFVPTTYDPANPTEPTVIGDGNITKFSNFVVLEDDSTGSYPYGATLIMLLANGDRNQYTVSASWFDQNSSETYVELLQELPVGADYNNAQVVEGFFGLSDQYVIPTLSDDAIPEGLTQTNISEAIRFAYRDTNTGVEVMNFTQFLLRESIAPNKFIITGDGRDVEEFISVTDTINVVEQIPSNNGNHVVTAINTVPTGFEIVVSSAITTSADTGFLETT